jgi:hypothetical protein
MAGAATPNVDVFGKSPLKAGAFRGLDRESESVFIGGNAGWGEGFCRPARQKIAGILPYFKIF